MFDPAFQSFLTGLTEFARQSEQALRDLSLVRQSRLHSPITGEFVMATMPSYRRNVVSFRPKSRRTV